jgi:colicin import membrane protein
MVVRNRVGVGNNKEIIMIKKLLILAQLSVISFGVSALETGVAYITDNVSIPIRTDKSFAAESVLIGISSGDRVELVQDDDSHEDWSKVKFGTTEGWILSRYLMPNISFKDKFKQLEVENKLLSERFSKIVKMNKDLKMNEHLKSDEFLSESLGLCFQSLDEKMEENRQHTKEFEAKQKEVDLLAEELQKELAQLKVGKPDKSNSEYQKEKTIKLQQAKIKHLKRKLKAESRKVEKLKNNISLRKEIQAEKDQERELAQEDILNELKVNYINQIASKVKSQWRYQGAKDNWGCDVYILQDSNGNVQSVGTQLCNVTYLAKKKSFKNAIERAVYKASPLPKAPIKSVFDREILFHFRVK